MLFRSLELRTATKVNVTGIEAGLHNLSVGARAAPPLRIGDMAMSGGELDLDARSIKVASVGSAMAR